MKPVFTSVRLHEIHHLRNVLESAGIRCHIRNEGLSTLAGEVPFPECAMQIVLEDESDLARAEAVLRAMRTPAATGADPWRCPACGEPQEAQFTACWKCGTEKS